MIDVLAKTQIVQSPELDEKNQNTVAISSQDTQFAIGVTSNPPIIEPHDDLLLTEIEHLFPTKLLNQENPEWTDLGELFEDVLDDVGMDLNQARNLLEVSPQFKQGLRRLLCKFMTKKKLLQKKRTKLSRYPGGYQKPKPVAQQLEILRSFFPGICDLNAKQSNLSPITIGNSEGQFVILRWKKIDTNYQGALQSILIVLEKAYHGKFHNFLKGMGSHRLQLHPKTKKGLEKLEEQQMNPWFIVATCQFGDKYAGKSVYDTLASMPMYEFGHDPFSVACMLLTHPERLKCSGDLLSGDLWINCAGARCTERNGVFDHFPFFGINQDSICLDTGSINCSHPGYGSSSFFVLDIS